MRTVVIGGYGNFGARICRALAANPNIDVIAAGRNPDSAGVDSQVKSARLDLESPDFASDMKGLTPELVIHCAGPFQGRRCFGPHLRLLDQTATEMARRATRSDRGSLVRLGDAATVQGHGPVPGQAAPVRLRVRESSLGS